MPGWSPLKLFTSNSSKKTAGTAPRIKRARKFALKMRGRTTLTVSFRYFRTKKENRSKLLPQLVFRTPGLRYREVAFTLYGSYVKKSYQSASRLKRLYAPEFSGAFFLTLGTLSAAYFSGQIYTSPEIVLASSKPLTVNTQTLPPPPEKTDLPRSAPSQIVIPKIKLSSAVIEVGKNTDGSMEMPKTYHQAGWYSPAPSPGEIGPAVIVGHVDNKDGPAVFWRIAELVPGDTIEVKREDARKVVFKVVRIEQYRQDNFPSEDVYGNIDHPGIRLITCGGKYDPKTNRYSHNTVVFGSLESG